MAPSLDELVIAAAPHTWAAAGFRVEDDSAEVGAVRLVFAGTRAGRGIVDWTLRDLEAEELDGLPTARSSAPPAAGDPHPNGARAVDHVVAFSPDLDRTMEALQAAGFDFRRLREGPTPGGSMRQAFFRIGAPLLEVIEAPAGSRIASDPDGPARLWGVAFLANDLGAPAAALGDKLGEPREAVQPRRRIATVRREAGLGPAVAFMTPG